MNKINQISTIQTTKDLQFPFSSLSKIIPSDKNLLHDAILRFRPTSKNYEDSWGYIIQATRHGGFKWYDPYTGFLLFFGYKPNDHKTICLATFFAEPEYFVHVVARVKDALKVNKIIIKNVNIDDIQKLTSLGFRQYKDNEGWNDEFRFDDQTFPQQIIDLKKLHKKNGTYHHKLRQALNKHNPNISFRMYNSSDYDEVLNLLSLKDGNSPNSNEKEHGMYFASHAMYPLAEIDKFIIQNDKTNEIIGFTATSDISSINTTLVASIFRVGIKVESVWGIHQTLISKYNEGFRIANLGGSETEGAYNFLKRKFRPVEEIQKTHLVYDL